jgi:hypothetical protein
MQCPSEKLFSRLMCWKHFVTCWQEEEEEEEEDTEVKENWSCADF